MILKPSIDDLLYRVHSKYSLVILSSKRAHELAKSDELLLSEYHSVKNVGRALEEIETGELIVSPDPEAKREQLLSKEKLDLPTLATKNPFDFLKSEDK
jgi:DNA-directed RNA polymerase subunit omega